MSYDEPVYSNRNGLMLLDDLPADLIPGAALAVAFRAGKSPKAEGRVEYLQRIIEVWPEGEADIRNSFTRGMEERNERVKAGMVRAGRTGGGPTWNERISKQRAEDRAVTVQEKADRIKADAIAHKANGGTLGEFTRTRNIHRKNESAVPGILVDIQAIWGDPNNA